MKYVIHHKIKLILKQRVNFTTGDQVDIEFEDVISLTSSLTKNMYLMIPDLQRRGYNYEEEHGKKPGKSLKDLRESKRVKFPFFWIIISYLKSREYSLN